MLTTNRFSAEDRLQAGAMVFWATPYITSGRIILCDHHDQLLGQNVLLAVGRHAEQVYGASKPVHNLARLGAFDVIRSPSWEVDPTKNIMVARATADSYRPDPDVMIRSLVALKALLDGHNNIMISWPSQMSVTGRALDWVLANAPPEWTVSTPYKYITDEEAARFFREEVARKGYGDATWRSLWDGLANDPVALQRQVAAVVGYEEAMRRGDPPEVALHSAFAMMRNAQVRSDI